MENRTVFMVSEDAAVRDSVKDLVESVALQVETFPSLRDFLETVASGPLGCLVLETTVADSRDEERQAGVADACKRLPTILITDRGDVPAAVRAVRAGAVDVVQKPYRDKTLLGCIQQALKSGTASRG